MCRTVLLALACLLLPGASAARLLGAVGSALSHVEVAASRGLKQVTDSFVTQGGNPYRNPVQIYAHAREAEAWSHARSMGIYENQGATVVTAGDTYPSGRSQAVSQNGQDNSRRSFALSDGGYAPQNQITLFGPTAIATTQQGYRAMSAVNGMPMLRSTTPSSDYSTSSASSTFRWRPIEARQGFGRERLVFLDSLGFTEQGPLSNGISETGGGPTAVAQAGEAVAMSQADTPENERYGRRRLRA